MDNGSDYRAIDCPVGNNVALAPLENQPVMKSASHPFSSTDLKQMPAPQQGSLLMDGNIEILATLPQLLLLQGQTSTIITYDYDPLNRLISADYNDGSYFHYTYDAVGNRLSQITDLGSTSYVYDIANRMTFAGGVAYTWDANGNLLGDGSSSYTYDSANRLSLVSQGGVSYSYAYNGNGDRLQQTVDSVVTNYTLDLNAGLSQVLTDGTNNYLYGLGRIGEKNTDWVYYQADALGSVRQLTDVNAGILLAQSYEPYGNVLNSFGSVPSNYGFASEWTDATGLQNLRARYLNTGIGRFLTRDTWGGNYNRPMSLNKWMYVEGNPINRIDPLGKYFWGAGATLFGNSNRFANNQNLHVRIQGLFMAGRMKSVHAEYTIPGTLYPIDLMDLITGEIWEIKPWDDRVQAKIDIEIRLKEIQNAKQFDRLMGKDPTGTPYNWNINPSLWNLGKDFPHEIYIGPDSNGYYDFYAGQVEPGIILWWKQARDNNPNDPRHLPYPIALPDDVVHSDRNRRPDWKPSPGIGPIPGPSPSYGYRIGFEEIAPVVTVPFIIWGCIKIVEVIYAPYLLPLH